MKKIDRRAHDGKSPGRPSQYWGEEIEKGSATAETQDPMAAQGSLALARQWKREGGGKY